MSSIRTRLLAALIVVVALVSVLASALTYRRVLSETSPLFDYQLRQMALSLRGQISVAPRIEVPPDQGDADFVVQIWDIFGTRVYLSRPGLPVINQAVLGFADLTLAGERWRAYGLQTPAGVIQIAQPLRVRETLARTTALRIVLPLLLLLPIMTACVAWVVQRGLRPLRLVTAEVQRRDERSLSPVLLDHLPREIAPLVHELNRLLAHLQRAFGAQRDFIADAAHELRSPLTALRLQLQLLDRAVNDAGRAEARSMLGAAVERAIHLVEQLLTLARMDPGAGIGQLEPQDLSAAARAAITDCHAAATARNIEMSLEAPAPVMLPSEPDALRMLVRNLVDNAVRYSAPGGHVAVVCSSDRHGALLAVCDGGPGIPEGERGRVFDRFYRSKESLAGGTGLGLAIVKAIADKQGAEVTLHDVADGGFAVRVRFPAAL